MKVVINRCFGGFGLSPAALVRVAELQGRSCYFFKNEFARNRLIPCEIGEAEKTLFISALDLPNPDEVIRQPSDTEWGKMSMEERRASNDTWTSHTIPNFRDDRTNPILVQVVEELKEKANGQHAKLAIVEVPDDAQWQIEEYDGNEHVAEVHRSWA